MIGLWLALALGAPGTTEAPPVPVAVSAIRAGCTADSMSVAMAGSLAAREMGRWSCSAVNMSDKPLTLSRAAFALDFIELRQLDPADVADVFNQKQKMTKQAKAARVVELIGFGALLMLGQNYFTVGVKAAQITGLATYGATKLGEYFVKQVPSTSNALAGMLTADVVLQPGGSIQWKVYASKMSGASHLGPRFLTTGR